MNASEIFEGKSFGLGGVSFGSELTYVIDEIARTTAAAPWAAGCGSRKPGAGPGFFKRDRPPMPSVR